MSFSLDLVSRNFDIPLLQEHSVSLNRTIGWLNMWDRNVPSAKYGFAGMLTAARDISVREGRLYQQPIVNCTPTYKVQVADKLSDSISVGVVSIKATDLESLDLRLRSNGENYTEIRLNGSEWVFDRSKSGEAIVGAEKDADSLNGIRRMPYSGNKETTLTIVMDEFSIEIFEDGRAMSSTVYPPCGADGLELSVKAASCHYERAAIIKD